MTRVDGVDYSPEAIETMRQEMIVFRDQALTQAAFGEAVALSWVIAYLAEYGDILHDPHIADIVEEWRRAG